MDNTQLQEFDPYVSEINTWVDTSKAIESVDIEDKEQVENFKKVKKNLQQLRISIQRTGKALREEALKYQKAVVSKEKEYISLIEPEENRMKALEVEMKLQQDKKDRLAILPQRKQHLASIEDGVEVSDEELLGMTDVQFQFYYQKRFKDKNEAQRLENERRQRELDEEAERLENERKTQEREAQARIDERNRIDREQKEAQERVRAEKEKLQKEESFQKFLKDNGYEGEGESKEMILKDYGDCVILYKFVAKYDK